MRGKIVTDAMDLLAGFDVLPIDEQKITLSCVVDRLGDYPIPYKKSNEAPENVNDLGAFLFVRNVRNACKLAMLDHIPTEQANHISEVNLMLALTLLTD